MTNLVAKSHMSLSSPVWQEGARAIGRTAEEIFKDRDIRRARVRSKSRYLLRADINQFYHSMYTHSMSWAVHDKATAKAKRKPSELLGNALDGLVRDCQDGQSTGMPIGPDTSLLIAEIILTANDLELLSRGIKNAFRIIDDYEFGCESLSEAEQTREALQELLYNYQLVLNSEKTHIVELPVAIETLPISQLRACKFSSKSPVNEVKQHNEIMHYFDQAFTFSREYPDDAVLKYAIAKLSRLSLSVAQANWPFYQNLLLQCAIVEPSTLDVVLGELVRYRDSGYSLDLDHITDVFNRIIGRHAPLGHGSEVAWALWGSIVLGASISDDNANRSVSMNDSIVAILTLDAREKGLISANIDFEHLQSYMTADELFGDQWLVAYEANVKGWLPSLDRSDHVYQDTCFAFLKKEGVYFYDDGFSGRIEYKPPRQPPAIEGY